MIYNFENLYILIICTLFLFIMNIVGGIKKKAMYPMITLIFFMASLIVHIIIRKEVLAEAFRYNVYLDLFAVGISITNLLIVDEIETRRNIIKGVFENRYKRKK